MKSIEETERGFTAALEKFQNRGVVECVEVADGRRLSVDPSATDAKLGTTR